MMLTRCLATVLLAAGAGFFSGLFAPATAGARGAILGAGLALGVLLGDGWGRAALAAGRAPSGWVLFRGATWGALLAALPLSLVPFPPLPHGDFPPPPVTPAGWPTLVVCLAYAFALMGPYRLRWRGGWWRLWSFLLMVAGGTLVATLRLLSQGHNGLDTEDALAGLLFCGLPFALPWTAAIFLADPGFSARRWQRAAGGAPPAPVTG
jgi:hypothetical protein